MSKKNIVNARATNAALSRGKRVDVSKQLVERARVGFPVPACSGLLAKGLDGLKNLLAFEPPDHITEGRGEKAYVVVKRAVLVSFDVRHRSPQPAAFTLSMAAFNSGTASKRSLRK